MFSKKKKCWMCEEIETEGRYCIKNSKDTLSLKIFKESSGQPVMQVWGEDVLQQEINYCPICGKRINLKLK